MSLSKVAWILGGNGLVLLEMSISKEQGKKVNVRIRITRLSIYLAPCLFNLS